MSGFSLDGEDYYLEYEGLHWLCTRCGMYGHRAEDCKTEAMSSKTGEVLVDEGVKENAKSKVTEDADTVEKELWRVVQKPRRQRREGKEKQSRYGILTWEEEGDVGDGLEDYVPVVHDGAGETSARIGTFSAQDTGEQRNGAKRRQSKNKSRAGESRVQGSDQKDLRKEKCTRDMVQKEVRKNKILRITYKQSKDAGITMEDMLVMGNEEEMMVGPNAKVASKVDDFSSSLIDLGESGPVIGLTGKFWAGPDNPDPDCVMVEDVQGDESGGTMVPETQLPNMC